MMRSAFAAMLALWVVGSDGSLSAQDPEPLSEDERILHVLSRFTPGATSALVAEVKAAGLAAWFEAQLKADRPESPAVEKFLKETETFGLKLPDLFEKYGKRPPDNAPEEEKKAFRRREGIPERELMEWVVVQAVHGTNPVRETACDFFRNHFTVSVEKDNIKHLAGNWERTVIRRHALGGFEDMLEASAKHAAMLEYLDNHISRRAPTPSELKQIENEVKRETKSKERAREAVDIAKQRGLNENYARELLELHTLGVDNGYTQEDVINLAKALTGWTFHRSPEKRFEFHFNGEMHSMDRKHFLGGTVLPKKDPSEGELILKALAQHGGTALFISRKLCRWLVTDDPDEKMVRRVAKVFNSSRGDVAKTLQAVLEDPDFFSRAHYRTKFKRPWEFVVSALRATGAEVTSTQGIDQALRAMNEPLYRCGDPTGYYDQAEAWRDPGAMATRWTFAGELVQGRVPGVRIPASLYEDLPADRPGEWKGILVRKILPVSGIGRLTSVNLDRLLTEQLKQHPRMGPDKAGPLIVGVLLGSPEFQKQ